MAILGFSHIHRLNTIGQRMKTAPMAIRNNPTKTDIVDPPVNRIKSGCAGWSICGAGRFKLWPLGADASFSLFLLTLARNLVNRKCASRYSTISKFQSFLTLSEQAELKCCMRRTEWRSRP
jgi:hypothetical protein